MPHPARPYAALLIPRAAGADPTVFLRGIAEVLNHRDGGATRISASHAAAAGETIIVRVALEQHPTRGARITFELAPRPRRKAPSMTRAVAILSDIVLRALPLVEARHVEWLQEGVALTPEEFVAAQSYVSPRRACACAVSALPETDDSIERIERNLARLLQEEAPLFAPLLPPAPDPAPTAETPPEPEPCDGCTATRRLPAMVAIVSWPVAAVLALVHARRSSDIRLSINVLAMAGTGAFLMQSGRLDPLLRLAGH